MDVLACACACARTHTHTILALLQVADFSNNQIEEMGDLRGHRALRNLNLSSILPRSVLCGDLSILVEGQMCKWHTETLLVYIS